jgi:hypothetical protein
VLLRDGTQVNVPLRFGIANSSGIGWGGISAGSFDLAFNILIAAGLALDEAADLHRRFAAEFLGAGSFPHEGGRIARDSIRHWIWLQRVCPHPQWEPHPLLEGEAQCVTCRAYRRELQARTRGEYRKASYTPWDRL